MAKKALRRLKRVNGVLTVVYVDAETGAVLPSLDGYTLEASNNDNKADIYFGTDKPIPADETPTTPTPTDTPGSTFDSSQVHRPNGSSDPNPIYDRYVDRDPAKGLKPEGTILGGIIKNVAGDVAGQVGNSFGATLTEMGKSLGLFSGTSAIGNLLGIESTPEVKADGTPKEDQSVINNILDKYWPGNPITGTAKTTAAPVQNVSSISPDRLKGLTPEVANVIAEAQKLVPFEIKLTSGARDPAKNKAVGGADKSQHLSGNAADISLAGLNDEQRTQLVRALVQSGATRIGAYSGNTGLHVDMKQQGPYNGPKGNYPVWPMFDKTVNNMDKAPTWFSAGLDGTKIVAPTGPTTTDMAGQAVNQLKNVGGAALDMLGGMFGKPAAPTSPTAASFIPGDPNGDPVVMGYLALVNKQEGAPTPYQAFGYVGYTDLSKHPNIYNSEYDSSAAGLYQINYPTWNEFAPKAGATDFSVSSQNKVAWEIAKTNYKVKTGGGDLYEALKSDDPAIVSTAFYKNSNRWASLPTDYKGALSLADEYLGLRNYSNIGTPAAFTDTGANRPVTTPTFQPNSQPFSGSGKSAMDTSTRATDTPGSVRPASAPQISPTPMTDAFSGSKSAQSAQVHQPTSPAYAGSKPADSSQVHKADTGFASKPAPVGTTVNSGATQTSKPAGTPIRTAAPATNTPTKNSNYSPYNF